VSITGEYKWDAPLDVLLQKNILRRILQGKKYFTQIKLNSDVWQTKEKRSLGVTQTNGVEVVREGDKQRGWSVPSFSLPTR